MCDSCPGLALQFWYPRCELNAQITRLKLVAYANSATWAYWYSRRELNSENPDPKSGAYANSATGALFLVRRTGLEPARVSSYAPQAYVSAISPSPHLVGPPGNAPGSTD